MLVRKLHADEVDIDSAQVSQLLAAQCPQWAELPLIEVDSAGTDSVLYRLGDDMVVRLPRTAGATWQIGKDARWLPRFAPRLPLAIPHPLALGAPGAGYPYPWAVYRWLPGAPAASALPTDGVQAARDLARFVAALQRIETTGWPPPAPWISSRGVPLFTRDVETRAAIAALDGQIDTRAAIAAWEAALAAPIWRGPAVWIHADLMPLNLLVEQGRLCAVIDFGILGVGDPACDLLPAWNFLTAETRAVFRETLAMDDATWARGRGWALSVGLIALPYYQHTNRALADISRRQIAEALADQTHDA
jgi:aminoglycoside phosphotransferase (APT) family kinase protein